VNPETEERINAGNDFNMTALHPDRTPASDTLGIAAGTLVAGEAIVTGQHYATSEQIVIKVTDSRGREAYSEPLTVVPVGVRYALATPDTVIAGQPWEMSVTRVDIVTGQLVTSDDRSFVLRAFSGSAPRPDFNLDPAGILADSVGTTVQGIRTFYSQSYDRAEPIYLQVSDDTGEQHYSDIIIVLPAPASQVVLWAEDLPGQPLARPLRPGQSALLVARATDTGGNPVAGVPLEFRVLAGDGRLGAAQEMVFATTANSDGRATVDLNVVTYGHEDALLEAVSNDITSPPIVVDIVGPPRTVLRFDPEAPAYQDGYYITTDTRIHMIATTDDPGGIQVIFFDLDIIDPPIPNQVYTGDFSLTDQGKGTAGEHLLRFYAEEVSGTTEAVQSITLYTGNALASDRDITNRPNPFRAGSEETVILFTPTTSGTVTLTIYDLWGDVVFSDQLDVTQGTEENYVWYGRNGKDKVVANGGYICRVYGSGMDLRRKIAVVK
jgi:hypothetical protein